MIVDGYVDEPTCLGVPPYLSTYPRYIAGAIWTHAPRTEIIYHTIDYVRESFERAWKIWTTADMLLLIAGMVVPGKYLGGTPISVREAFELFSNPRLNSIPKLLVGPWAQFGCGLKGGKVSLSSEVLSPPFDYIISGDPEVVIGAILESNKIDDVSLDMVRTNAEEIEPYIIRGVHVIRQHPSFAHGHIICEIETYRGCARFLTGGCSFCIEPSHGFPQVRSINNIVREIEALYAVGVRAFRLGRQADLFVYGSREIGIEEFPCPEPKAIEELFSKIRRVAPALHVLHIDNVNPGTVARHPTKSREVARAIIKYHTLGDVAAFGVESADPTVIRRNNLKASPEESLEAVRIINEVGGWAPTWELPHLLPGINLVYGLPGETKATLEHNMAFLQRILEEGLRIRRINIRQVIGFSNTRLGRVRYSRIKHHEFFQHKQKIREQIDIEMLRRVAPHGTIIHSVFLEKIHGNSLLLRPLASYPLLCYMPSGTKISHTSDVFVVDHGPRSVTVLPYPFNPNHATIAQWKCIPNIGVKRAARLKRAGPWKSISAIESHLGITLPEWLYHAISFENRNGGPGRI